MTGCWFDARVLDVAPDFSKVSLHFVGWAKKHDEVFELPRDLEKLAPHRTFSAVNKRAKQVARGTVSGDKKKKTKRARKKK